MASRIFSFILMSCILSMDVLGQIPEGFVFIKGAVYENGRVRVEDFEILDHPVTNAEYWAFIDDTGQAAPLHWQNGQIPVGKEEYPVIFVNRYDVRRYLQWLTDQDGRVYRLPTGVEFRHAAYGGLNRPRYPWGDEEPSDQANYDANGSRRFDAWQTYLRPAKWGQANGYGLYGVAGNVWQMVLNRYDPATKKWIYRLAEPEFKGQSVMGGSWARGAAYLRCGYGVGMQAGLRHPDLGFRPVREPKGHDWRLQVRRMCAVSHDNGEITLSWGFLRGDARDVRFHVYRASDRNHSGQRITKIPLSGKTCFTDTRLKPGRRYQYYVQPVDTEGRELRRSEWVGATVKTAGDPLIATYTPICKPGSLVPIFGDLNGDGALDCVIRMDNGNHEMSQDSGVPVQMEAFTSYGRSLWRKDICFHDHCYGSANNVPFNVWDMDGDGQAEVITRLQIGESVYLAVLDGMSAKVKHKTPWVPIATDHQGSSTRIHLSIAYLDGNRPAVITQSGLYENEIFTAYDAALNPMWQFKSFGETSGSGGHKIEVADVDGDGKQEVFNGTTCINHDGSLRWSIYRQHPDIVSIHDYLPERPGLEVFYIVESSMHAGVYMVDANSGEAIWKLNREDDSRWTHGHRGWTADIWNVSPGLECISNRAGHNDSHLLMFSASGRLLLDPFPNGYTPVEWDGDDTRELLIAQGAGLSNFNGTEAVTVPGVRPNPIPDSHLLMVADLCGDFRDELVVNLHTEEGKNAIGIVTATEPMGKRYLAAWEDLGYRLWVARNRGGGYASIYDRVLKRGD
ncbi:MAG: rhamnogalacturonan lyase family protein [Planctomycetota bacterium]